MDGRADIDTVVIGSGFGGSVAALRLAEKGDRVVVLEMGRRIADEDMAAAQRSPRKLVWAPALGLRGHFRQTVLDNLFLMGGVGVGGGSLVYGAVLLEPGDAFYRHPAWGHLGVDWRAELAPHYRRAAVMLGRAPNPDRGRQDEWMAAAADAVGVPGSYGAVPQGITFDGPDGCTRCGGCLAGCPHRAKNTLDRTYLRRAEQRGAEIRTGHRVERIVPLPGGGFRIESREPWPPFRTHPPLTARRVVLAAGVVGTLSLLLACRDRWATLPDLSPTLGELVRTNGEGFVAILQPDGEPDVSVGASISSDFYVDERTHVTQNRFPASYGFFRGVLGPLVSGRSRRERARRTVAEVVREPRRALANLTARRWHERITVLTVMQHTDSSMRVRLRRGLAGWRLRSTLPAGEQAPPTHLPQAVAAGRAVAAASGGTPYGFLPADLLGLATTAHILGGCPMGADAATGVIGTDHQVHGYPGLYVFDGSAIPANVGVNPSLTITAMAERAAARMPPASGSPVVVGAAAGRVPER